METDDDSGGAVCQVRACMTLEPSLLHSGAPFPVSKVEMLTLLASL